MYGVTIMCDSWTGPTEMSIMNFMVYCNGIIFFHKSVDCTGHIQDVDFVHGVSIMLPNVLFSCMSSCYLQCVYLVFTGNLQNCYRTWSRTYCADCN
jgi:hypothetical protein